MITIYNLQKKIEVEKSVFEEFTIRAKKLADLDEAAAITIAFVPDKRMKQLNDLFRGKNTTTDVLSFPHGPDEFDPDNDNLGDIVISVEQAQKQAAENGLTLEAEIKQLILHGLLHLCGYDHETDGGEMNARELDLRDKLGI